MHTVRSPRQGNADSRGLSLPCPASTHDARTSPALPCPPAPANAHGQAAQTGQRRLMRPVPHLPCTRSGRPNRAAHTHEARPPAGQRLQALALGTLQGFRAKYGCGASATTRPHVHLAILLLTPASAIGAAGGQASTAVPRRSQIRTCLHNATALWRTASFSGVHNAQSAQPFAVCWHGTPFHEYWQR